MTLTGQEMQQLATDAKAFDSGHVSFIAEAVNALSRRTEADDSAIEALELLVGIWKGGFASKPNQKDALNNVGRWLEKRIRRDTAVTAERLQLELGWLKRLAKTSPEERAAGPVRTERIERSFGEDIERLKGLRTRQKRAQRPHNEEPVRREQPPAPQCLPERFTAAFVELALARDARQSAKKRLKANKEPKETLLALRADDPLLQPFASNLMLSTVRTTGFNELFDKIEENGGRSVPFEVVGWEEAKGSRIARAVAARISKSK